MVMASRTSPDGVTPLKIKGEIDEVRLEAALGHKQELKRNFGLWSLTSLGIVIANSWASTGGTIVAALRNGGPMAVIYGLILVSIFYTAISASLAELASSMPSAGGVYYWSSVLSRNRGRGAGFFTGYLNACAWLLSASSMSSMLGNEAVAMYLLNNTSVRWQNWQVFICFQVVNWACCAIVCLGNRFIPLINRIALALSMSGLLATIVVLLVMPTRYASNAQVWTEYHNKTGGWSDGLIRLSDCPLLLHPRPRRRLLQQHRLLPTAEIYRQATGSNAGAIALIAVLFLATFPTLIGTFVTGGRMWWSLARDNATPFASYFAHVHPTLNCPVRATVAMSTLVTCLGCIYIGSTTAFQALISSFIVLSSLSYFGAILPHVLSCRRNMVPGPFYMGQKLGMTVNIVALIYILVTVVFFCFPLELPVTVQNMNYTSVITTGLMVLMGLWWLAGKEGRRSFIDVASIAAPPLAEHPAFASRHLESPTMIL
ncbi:hypothetical protein N7470_004858 [Penicillium chermesinum]|nr:hypothetical protein N7470_004858 [Penicillium chermesinum]